MINIPGYLIKDEIYKSQRTIIYKAIKENNKKKVMIKLLRKEYPSPDEIDKFKYEYDIVNKLNQIEGIIKNHEIIKYKNSLAIIMEDIEGISLDYLIKNKKINIDLFLNIAIKLVDILDKIHKNNIIHKDIKPANIIINENKNNVYIIDFSISTQIPRENQEIINPDHLEGTLAYISPEQTGRMNRSIDYRTDFYSLGITFYEMLTGKVPFESDDPLEMVHAHIAKKPIPPKKINNEIPDVISNIILKLLSKNPEDRYKNLKGLLNDLIKCNNFLIKKNKILNFKIAQKDISDKLEIPEKLYGREKEILLLNDTFKNIVSFNKEIIYVTGSSGIGKSVLINELNKIVIENKGYYIKGKYDKFKKGIPYSGIINAFQDLIAHIITESKKNILNYKKKILSSIGANGQILINVIPELEFIIGKQPELQKLNPIESKNRFNLAFENFLKVFTKEAPFVLFLDDLQWCDDASLQLINVLLNDYEINNFLFIGAYRENEINDNNSFLLFNEQIKKTDIKINILKLKNLKDNDIAELLSDTFHCNIKNIKELSSVIRIKTDGNPFFIKEFIKSLYQNKLIYFKNKWLWDIEKIKNMKVTDNVIDLMSQKIKKLPESSLKYIKLASCIGNEFKIDIITNIYNKNNHEVLTEIKLFIKEGMLIKTQNNLKFLHDRIREAAYSIINENEKKELHYKIGNYFLKLYNLGNKNLIFIITNQLNIAVNLLNEKEKYLLIDFNLKSGKKAKESSAFESASKYFKSAISIMPKNAWEKKYDVIINLYIELSESEYLARNYKSAEKYFNIIINKTKNIIDRIKIEKIIIDYYTIKMDLDNSINKSLKLLKMLGFKLKHPKKINMINVILIIIKLLLNKNIRKKNTKFLYNLDKINNTIKNEIINILVKIGFSSFSVYPNAYVYITFAIVLFSIKYGLNSLSLFALCGSGSVYCVLGNFELGYKIGETSIKLLKKFNNKSIISMNYFVFGSMINHWKKNVNTSIKYVEEGFKHGIENGNLQWAAYNLNFYCLFPILTGENLEVVKERYDNLSNTQKKLKQEDADTHFYPPKQFVYNLIGLSKNKFKMISNFYNEEKEIIRMKTKGYISGLSVHYTFKLILLFILNDKNDLLNITKKAEKFLSSNLGQFQTTYLNLFIGLSYIKFIKNEKHKYFNTVLKIQKKIKKWHESCPENFSQMYYLISAEIERLKKNYFYAMKYYDEAIKSAKENKFINIEAIANELAAYFYKSRGMNKIFKTYMTETCYCYIKWGAKAKIEELEKEYPDIFESLFNIDSQTQDILRKTYATISKISKKSYLSFSGSFGSLDLDTIMKATQTISSEITLEGLLKKLVKILIENAGAQKGIIIINKNGRLLIEAISIVDKKNIEVLQSLPIEDSKDIAQSIINYVERTKESVNLNDAVNEGIFTEDKYIKKNKPKSILCMPILHQKNLLGILYLENNLSTKAFTLGHMEVLQILASQAAISIQNVFLYESSKEKELLKKEMRIASEIQMNMLPEQLPEIKGYDINAICIMAKEAGGDLYDVLKLDENNYLIIIGDVSGKGMPAALYMSSTINMIRTLIERSSAQIEANRLNPENIIKMLNKLLRNVMKKGKFVTLFLGVLNTEKHYFKFTCAGHDPCILFNPKKNVFRKISTNGQACGILPSTLFDKNVEEKKISISKGDYFIFNTDGITEAKNFDNKEYMENYYKNIQKLKKEINTKELLSYIINDVNNFVKNASQYDDMTLLCIKRL